MATRLPDPPHNTVVGYIRVSTAGQRDEGISLDAQRERIQAYCVMHGLALLDIVEDAGVSATTPLNERRGGANVVAMVEARQVSGVVAAKLDRLFRNATDCKETVASWDKAGVALHLLDFGGVSVDTHTPMGKFFLHMAAGFAELERDLISDRTKTALASKRAKGERVGTIPYGYHMSPDGEHLEPNPKEQATVGRAKALRGQGLTLRAVAAALATEGHQGRTGKPFAAHQIARMVGEG